MASESLIQTYCIEDGKTLKADMTTIVIRLVWYHKLPSDSNLAFRTIAYETSIYRHIVKP